MTAPGGDPESMVDKATPLPPEAKAAVSSAEGGPTAREITGYHQDQAGDWVAELSCGHDQHVRHSPPFRVRDWVLTEAGRTGRLGQLLECPLCDRADPPECLGLVRTSKVWDEKTMPAGLRRRHRLAARTWGRLLVHEGEMRFQAATSPVIDRVLESGTAQAIPPEIEHEVEPIGAVRFSIEFLTVDREAYELAGREEAGDAACWAAAVCPECGAMAADGYHRPGCALSDAGF